MSEENGRWSVFRISFPDAHRWKILCRQSFLPQSRTGCQIVCEVLFVFIWNKDSWSSPGNLMLTPKQFTRTGERQVKCSFCKCKFPCLFVHRTERKNENRFLSLQPLQAQITLPPFLFLRGHTRPRFTASTWGNVSDFLLNWSKSVSSQTTNGKFRYTKKCTIWEAQNLPSDCWKKKDIIFYLFRKQTVWYSNLTQLSGKTSPCPLFDTFTSSTWVLCLSPQITGILGKYSQEQIQMEVW